LVLTSDRRFPVILIQYSVLNQASPPLMGHHQIELYRVGRSEITKL
jgi:hypothetical protein